MYDSACLTIYWANEAPSPFKKFWDKKKKKFRTIPIRCFVSAAGLPNS